MVNKKICEGKGVIAWYNNCIWSQSIKYIFFLKEEEEVNQTTF